MIIKVDAGPVPTPAPQTLYPAYKVNADVNPNVHGPNIDSPALGYILHDTVIFIDTITQDGKWGHMRPCTPYLNGGLILMSSLTKQG